MRSVDTTDDFYQSIQADRPTLACFEASWCGDCHFIKPFYPEIESLFDQKLTFIQLDIDQLPAIAQHHEVIGIPSYIVFRSGQEVFRFVNSRRKTKEEIVDFIEKALDRLPQ